MFYIVRYLENKSKYEASYIVYASILAEKEYLFQRTQPKGIEIKSDLVDSPGGANPLEEYMIRKEALQIDTRLAEALSILEHREQLLRRAESDLRASKGIYDKIYTARYLDGMSVRAIARRMHYSESNVYRILSIIDRKSRKQRV